MPWTTSSMIVCNISLRSFRNNFISNSSQQNEQSSRKGNNFRSGVCACFFFMGYRSFYRLVQRTSEWILFLFTSCGVQRQKLSQLKGYKHPRHLSFVRINLYSSKQGSSGSSEVRQSDLTAFHIAMNFVVWNFV
jgi:hypothetical protein